MTELRALVWLLKKDFLIDYRSPVNVSIQAIFSIAAGIVVGMVYRGSVWPASSMLPPSLVIVILFQSVFSAYNSFLKEVESGTIEGLRLIPVGGGVVYSAKMFYSTTSIFIFTVLYTGALAFFSGGVDVYMTGVIVWIIAASLMLGSVSSLASAMMVYSRSANLMAPALILVLSAPFFYIASNPLNTIAQGYSPEPGWGSQLLVMGLGFYIVAVILSKYIIE
ncbi:MAG: heme exporter protein CcmB [Desulfurococcales archaeon]|nr:heme exporter protein CcmB [Desulfurococcales archaeon]